MDTLSRDSSSSSNNILPMVAIAIGGIGLLIGIFGMAKASKLEKALNEQTTKIQEVDSGVRSEVQRVEGKIDSSISGLRQGVEQVLAQVSGEMGTIKAQITKLEEEAKKKAVPVAAAGKGGPAVATGTVDANGNYTVAPGDTINKIAKKFATKPDTIEAENPGLNPTKLRVGQKIKIPRK